MLVSGAGLGMDPAPWLVLGLGSATGAERVVIDRPDGRESVIPDLPVDRPILVDEPATGAGAKG